jgi:YfiH family protein
VTATGAGAWAVGSQEDRVSGLRGSWVFTGRQGGVSVPPYESLNVADHVGDDPVAVGRNRGIMASLASTEPGAIAIMAAAHGRSAAEVRESGTVSDVDILVTRETGLGLVALAADCVPIVLCDARSGVVAAVHCGWRGVVADTAGAAVEAMADVGAVPGQTMAVLGSAICPACYEVSDDMRREVTEVEPAAGALTRSGEPAVNVQAGVTAQLKRAGVGGIRRDSRCTYEEPRGLFSYRRDGTTGRQAAIVRLEEGVS